MKVKSDHRSKIFQFNLSIWKKNQCSNGTAVPKCELFHIYFPTFHCCNNSRKKKYSRISLLSKVKTTTIFSFRHSLCFSDVFHPYYIFSKLEGFSKEKKIQQRTSTSMNISQFCTRKNCCLSVIC